MPRSAWQYGVTHPVSAAPVRKRKPAGTRATLATAKGTTKETTINAVLRALDVLFTVAESTQPTIGVTEISDQLGVSKAIVYRILSSLRAKGMVEIDQNTHRYFLGPKVLALGEAYRSRLDLRAICRDEMVELVQATNETATLSLRHGC
jgi:IclR family acetate operon transcriptional repressor